MHLFKGLIIGLVISSFASLSQAADYIVALKKAEDFQQISQQFYAAPVHGLFNNLKASSKGMRVFAADIHMTKSLDNIELMIVSSENPKALEIMKKDPRVLTVQKDLLFPAPAQSATFSNEGTRNFSPVNTKRPWGIDAVNAPEAWNVTRGEGVKVLVVDTGLDRDHPEFTGRVLKGKNFLGRRTNDPAPYDYFDDNGHGTHVAGTILGTTTGVAPDATLLAGRVCGAFGCGFIAITSAVDWGVAEGVQVMNLSLGGPCSGPVNVAYKNAQRAGVTVVAASGNSAEIRDESGNVTGYKEGVSCPGAYSETIGVGAISPDKTRAGFSQFGAGLDLVAPGVEVLSSVPMGAGRESRSKFDFGQGLEHVDTLSFVGSGSGAPIVGALMNAGIGKAEDFVGSDYTGRVALIARGEIFFAKKVENAVNAGATAVVIYNNIPGSLSGAITQDGSELSVPVVSLNKADGERISAMVAAGDNIVAQVEVAKTNYGSLQGTSMASPHIAGVAALVHGARPGLNLTQVRGLLTETASDLGDAKGTGAGLVDAARAVNAALEL